MHFVLSLILLVTISSCFAANKTPAFSGPDFSGVYQCTGLDMHEGEYKGKVTLKLKKEHSQAQRPAPEHARVGQRPFQRCAAHGPDQTKHGLAQQKRRPIGPNGRRLGCGMGQEPAVISPGKRGQQHVEVACN